MESKTTKIFAPNLRRSPAPLEVILLVAALVLVVVSLSGMFGFISW